MRRTTYALAAVAVLPMALAGCTEKSSTEAASGDIAVDVELGDLAAVVGDLERRVPGGALGSTDVAG
ncbi:hypothetical protein CH256_14985, partial [Rhodococcus sp. 05-2254-6]